MATEKESEKKTAETLTVGFTESSTPKILGLVPTVKPSYSVGDFVWGQVKWRPWWPGRIYDPSHASECAAKYRQAGRLLVVYFGDGSFSWCLPSELKPFAEDFEEMSMQSGMKSFVNAVEKGIAEIGALLEREMTCKCEQQKERISGLSRPPLAAVDGGVVPPVLVPNGGTCKLSLLPRYEPHVVLFMLRNLAQATSLARNRMEIVFLTSWLSAFYRAKGGYPLCCYGEASPIEGLEDMATDHASPHIVIDQNESGSVGGMTMESQEGEGFHYNLSIPKSSKKRKPMATESCPSRKRKKSKYVSYPYTTSLSSQLTGSSLAKGGFELGYEIAAGRVMMSDKIAMPELRRRRRRRRKQSNLYGYEAAAEEEEDIDAGSKLFPISLILTFSPGHSLPSKEEVVKIFGRYGALNVKETNTHYNSNFVRVVYERGCDAEAAFREAIKQAPFAASSVDYMLRPCSDAPLMALGGSGNMMVSSPRHPNPKPVLDSSSDSEILLFGSIKRSIAVLKSLLKKRRGVISQAEKRYLEDEFKVLLEKVRTMDGDAAAPMMIN